MRAPTRRIGQLLLYACAVVHEGVIPFTGILCIEGFFDERHELIIMYLFAGSFSFSLFDIREECMDEDGADVGLDEGVGDVKSEGEDGAGGIWADARQAH